MRQFTLHHGDCIAVLKTMPDCSVDSIVTDPPYELGFMGKSWDASGIAYNVELWREALRVLKHGGHLLAFSGSRTYHRMTCAIEDAGFQIRDQIMWVYASGFPKSHNLDGEWDGWGTALKPAHEPICVARKPLIGTVAANVLAHGTGALNIEACRIDGGDTAELAKHWNRETIVDMRGGNYGSGDKGRLPISKSAPSGRWPANLIHDGSAEVVALFPETTSGKPSGTRNASKTGGGFSEGWGDVPVTGFGDTGSAARFFYCAKASRADRNEGLTSGDAPAVATKATMREREDADWSTRNGNHHPTVKPTDLMAYLCRLVTPPTGTVLDMFMGSGSTGKAAMREGFDFIGIDMTAEYVEIAKARIEHERAKFEVKVEASPQLDLFGGAA